MLTTSEHRAAWDTTISAPKSVSLGALVGGDEFEKYLQARGGGPPSRHDFCPNRSGYVKPLNRLLQTAV